MKDIQYIFGTKPILLFLLVVNFIGTLYGYYWYGSQLSETPARFIVFVPDSPTASLFFLIVLIGFLFKHHWSLFEALAIVTLMKYGIWAVIMNLLVLLTTGDLHWTGYMLIVSHFAMAVQGVLYAPYYRFKLWHLVIAAIWTLHNDFIDYVFGMMPNYSVLTDYMPQIGYFTFWLSVVCLITAYALVLSPKSSKLQLP
ncbi:MULTISPECIES: DUF1405 domain-containing protein [Bacillus]|uniref:DUF1405 domain-containing protein n=2 Tax=Bacillus TaxID=1386 RepID=A0A0M4FQE0_9BACI|nr:MULTISPECIES: DUF1405 domain-containing protein [Bacillus]ALC81398.1 hypothetical protein AM592_07170 [Bacillus gobiensis]MBP1080430.1 putative membrane protein YpjA [Bacillus capparidis]MED1094287.1 DUF1405 domain-containing protein [Bacillus capparidis]